jgi:hypothetical protein
MSTTITVAAIDAAITAVLEHGQTVAIGGVQYSKANLNALRQLRSELVSETSRSGGTRPVFRATNLSGMGY